MLRAANRVWGAAKRLLRSRATGEARRQLARKDGEIAALRRQLAEVGGERAPSEDTPIFFVLGYQRSGTTWLMRMLDAHPEILCKGEGRFFGAWRQKSLKESADRPASTLSYAMRDAEYLRLWTERSVWSRDESADAHIDNLTRIAADYFLRSELLKIGKRLVGDKSPLLTPQTMEEAAGIYPDARVIHIIRDGRDAAVSAVHHSWNFGNAPRDPEVAALREAYRKDPEGMRERGESIFAPGQLEKLASDWSARVGRAVKDGPALLGENYAEVRYEVLVERPEKELARLLSFLGVEAGEESVQRCIGAASFERLSEGRKRGQEDPASFFRKGVAGDWRNTFTERDREMFEAKAGGLLGKLGYEKDDRW